MRIIIDLQSAQGMNENRGIGRYSLSLSQALARQAGKHEIYLLLNANYIKTIETVRMAFDGLIPSDHIKIFEVPKKIAAADYKNTWRIKASEKIREHFIETLSPDLVYISSIFEGWNDDAPLSIGEFQQNTLTAATLYDLIPYIYQDIYVQQTAPHYFFQKMQYLKRSELLITLSDSASQEAIEHLAFPSHQIVNCSVGIDKKFKIKTINEDDKHELKKKYNINRDFIFYIGGFDFRKNVMGLIEAFFLLPDSLQKKFQLVIILSVNETQIKDFLSLLRQRWKFLDELILIDYVSEKTLITLYNSCNLFVFASLHEGFGLPIIEAMACGAPTISSNISSMPEAIGCQEALFDPKNPQSIANKITEVLANNDFLTFLKQHGPKQAKKFTWENTAKKALTAFENVYAIRNKSTKTMIPRHYTKKMAFVSPLPPKKIAAADYSTRLLPELARFYDIVLITDQSKIDDKWLNANFEIHNTQWFIKYAASFDIIVYQFGNSSHYHSMLKLLTNHPGILILHDFFLSKLFNWADNNTPNQSFIFTDALYDSHGYPALIYHKKNGRENSIKHYPCNFSILNRALGIIVHSPEISHLAKEWYGSAITQKFKSIRPIYFSKVTSIEDKKKAKEQLGFSENDFIICSFGLLHPHKLNHRLISACSDNLLKNKHIYLIFIGKKPSASYFTYLTNLIKNNTIRKKIKFTGYVNKTLYKNYLLATDISIELRSDDSTEISNCLLDCLSFGISTITNQHKSIKALPCDLSLTLQHDFTDLELANCIIKLYKNRHLRLELSMRALAYIKQNHHPAKIGAEYHQLITNFHSNHYFREQMLINNLAGSNCTSIKPDDLIDIASAMSANRLSINSPQLLIDISELINDQQQTLRSIPYNLFLALINAVVLAFRLEPIYYHKFKNKYLYAREFTIHSLELSATNLQDSIVTINQSDIYLALSPPHIETIQIKECFDYWKVKGVKFYSLVCAQPIRIMNHLLEIIEACICLKKDYLNPLIAYLDTTKIKRKTALKIESLALINTKNISSTLIELIQKNQWSEEWIQKPDGKPSTQNVINRAIYIDKIKYDFEGDTRYLGSQCEEYDPTLIAIFKTFCNENSYVLDLGANIGITSIALANICTKAKVAAVEPVPITFKMLQSNIKKANLNNLSLHNFAIGNKKGEISMQLRTDFLAGAFIADRYQADYQHQTVNVKIECLDDVFDRFKFPCLDFIKMDLEGYELFALEGAKKTIKKFKPIVYLEMNHWCLNVFFRITLPEFKERLQTMFPYIYAIEYPSYLDFTTIDNFYHIAHEHITTTRKYFNLIAGFDKKAIIERFTATNMISEAV